MADSSLVSKDPFPGEEPVGPGIHSNRCRNKVVTAAKPDPEIPQGQLQMLSSNDFCITVNNHMELYSAEVGKSLFDAFSKMQPWTKDRLEKELGCKLLSRRIETEDSRFTGNVVLQSVPYILGDQASEERGNQFLRKWLREAYIAETNGCQLSLMNLWKESTEPACKTDSKPANRVTFNGNCVYLASDRLERICDSFSKDIIGRGKVEKLLDCYFTTTSSERDHSDITLTVKTPRLIKSSGDIAAVERRAYDFLDAWIQRVKSISSQETQTPSIYQYWEEYNDLVGTNSPPRLGLVIHETYFFDKHCSLSTLKNLSYSFTIDDRKPTIEQLFQCQIALSERDVKKEGTGLKLKLIPFPGADTVILKKAGRFLYSWALKALQENPIKISAYWESLNGAKLEDGNQHVLPIRDSDQPIHPVKQAISEDGEPDSHITEGLAREIVGGPFSPILLPKSEFPLGNPEDCWEKYAKVHNATDTDRLLIEEQAKVSYHPL